MGKKLNLLLLKSAQNMRWGIWDWQYAAFLKPIAVTAFLFVISGHQYP